MADWYVPSEKQAEIPRKIWWRLFHLLVALAPALLTGWLYLMALRASQLIGHMPVPWVDDPKFIPFDRIYDFLRDYALIVILWHILAFIIMPSTTAGMWRYNPRRVSWIMIGIYAVSFVLYWFVGSELLTWYFD